MGRRCPQIISGKLQNPPRDLRLLTVEYKGEHLWSNDDSKEQRAIGELWEAYSGGRCLFVRPKGQRFEEIRVKAQSMAESKAVQTVPPR